MQHSQLLLPVLDLLPEAVALDPVLGQGQLLVIELDDFSPELGLRLDNLLDLYFWSLDLDSFPVKTLVIGASLLSRPFFRLVFRVGLVFDLWIFVGLRDGLLLGRSHPQLRHLSQEARALVTLGVVDGLDELRDGHSPPDIEGVWQPSPLVMMLGKEVDQKVDKIPVKNLGPRVQVLLYEEGRDRLPDLASVGSG